VLGNCGVTNKIAGARSPVMTWWVDEFGCVYARAREEMIRKYWR